MKSMTLAVGLVVAAAVRCPAGTQTVVYSYDGAGRLITACYTSGGTNAAVHYGYDAGGNRTNVLSISPGNRATDTDGDGMPDLSELVYFEDLTEIGSGDADADGLANGQELGLGSSPVLEDTDADESGDYAEYVADTDPADSNDFFRAAAGSNLPPMAVYFSSSSNRAYVLRWTSTPGGTWSNVPGAGPRVGAGGTDHLEDAQAGAATTRFYRVGVDLMSP